jgi:hypothetical protein
MAADGPLSLWVVPNESPQLCRDTYWAAEMVASRKAIMGNHPVYSEAERDALAERGAETLSFKPGASAAYDVENFERIPRRSTPPGSHITYELPAVPGFTDRKVPSVCFGKRPYLLRIGGVRRGTCWGPDEMAVMLRKAGIRYCDSFGNGLFETLLLCKKHGLWPVFESPALGFQLPFLEQDLPPFRKLYRRRLRRMKSDLKLVEEILGTRLVGREGQPWIVWMRFSPLALFFSAVERAPEAVAEELKEALGFSKAPVFPSSPEEEADQARFWSYVRRRHGQVLMSIAELFREEIVGKGVLVGNMHANPPVDYALLVRALDFPGIAVRPCYLEDKEMSGSHVAFSVKLIRDLTGRPPVVSIRSNLLSAGSRFIPGRNLLAAWHDAALRAGIAGFYFWPWDFPAADSDLGYNGPMFSNPDPSARGMERWRDNLELLAGFSGLPVFSPPPAQVGILVCHQTLDRLGWKKVFSTYRACEAARVWVSFLDAQSFSENPGEFRQIKLLIVPSLPFSSSQLIKALREFSRSGCVLTGQEEIGMRDLQGFPRPEGLTVVRAAGKSVAGNGDVTLFPTLDRVLEKGDEALVSLVTALQSVACDLQVETQSWVYDVTVESLRRSCPTLLADFDSAPIGPGVKLEHYLYEHSSNWILPFLDDEEPY